MDARDLARLEHENFISALMAVSAQIEGGVFRRGDGIAVILTGSPLRLFNQVLVDTDDEAPSVEAIAAAVALARERGDPFVVSLRDGTDDGLVGLVTELGLVPMRDGPFMPGMALYPPSGPGSADRTATDEHRIQLVEDVAGIEDHVATVASGFELSEEIARQVVTPALLERPEARVYVGYAEGRPVTTGLGYRTGDTIGVYNIATVPSHRRRGYGEAMTWRVVADGVADGCTAAVLQASDMGRPIYERMGFRTVVDYMGWVEPPREDGPDAT